MNKNPQQQQNTFGSKLLISNQAPIEPVGSDCKALAIHADQEVQEVQRAHLGQVPHLFREVLEVPVYQGSSFHFHHLLLGVLELRVVQAVLVVPGVLGLGFGQVVRYLLVAQRCQGFQAVQRVQQVQVDLVDWVEPEPHHLHHLQEVPWDPVRLGILAVPLGKAVDKAAAY